MGWAMAYLKLFDSVEGQLKPESEATKEKRQALREELQDFRKVMIKSLEKADGEEYQEGVWAVKKLEKVIAKLKDSGTEGDSQMEK